MLEYKLCFLHAYRACFCKYSCFCKGKAYDDLYQRLGTEEGEKDIYRMARIRERKTRDINQIKCIKDGTDQLLVKDEEIRDR